MTEPSSPFGQLPRGGMQTGRVMTERTIEDLERELRGQAFARNAELVVDTGPDGRFRAAFENLHDVILLEATATDKRVALESLLTAAEEDE